MRHKRERFLFFFFIFRSSAINVAVVERDGAVSYFHLGEHDERPDQPDLSNLYKVPGAE